MSVTMTKAEGVTVLTLTSDTQSVLPPLCQILKGLCYSPVCCSVSQHLRNIQRTSQTTLATLHIMVGSMFIGLGLILTISRYGSSWQMDESGFPYWLGALFVFFGVVGILSEKYPSPCLVIVNVILHLAGVGFAIAAIVLYSINLGSIWVDFSCYDDMYYSYRYHRYNTPQTPSPSEVMYKRKCDEAAMLTLMLLRGINIVLIVLSVLELCLVISSAVMSIKALATRQKGQKEKVAEPELYNPLLQGVSTHPSA